MSRVNVNYQNSGQTLYGQIRNAYATLMGCPTPVMEAIREGKTPLMVAIINGHTDIVELLLTVPEINVNLRDNSGKTALMHAVISGRYQMVSLLLEREDVEVDIQDKNGETALIHARRGRNGNLIRLFRLRCVRQRCKG